MSTADYVPYVPKTRRAALEYLDFLYANYDFPYPEDCPSLADWPHLLPRQRKVSVTALIRQARKAGERGPVTVTLPDGTTIVSEREGAEATAATNPWDKVLTNATH
jgi:hypothetical protein